jgi:hypothetical protein
MNDGVAELLTDRQRAVMPPILSGAGRGLITGTYASYEDAKRFFREHLECAYCGGTCGAGRDCKNCGAPVPDLTTLAVMRNVDVFERGLVTAAKYRTTALEFASRPPKDERVSLFALFLRAIARRTGLYGWP